MKPKKIAAFKSLLRVANPLLSLMILSLWISGCTSLQISELAKVAKPPNISLGSVHELLQFKTSMDKVRVVLDRSGLGHVIVSSSKLEEVHHIVVGPEGVLEQEIIRSDIWPVSIDAAFDAAGLLHVLIDDEHWVKENGIWSNVEHTPWKEAGFKKVFPNFVSGAKDLIFAFSVGGDELGTPKRFDWYGFGGFNAGIIWPWLTSGRKLVFVTETNSKFTNWTVLDPQDKFDASNVHIVADFDDNVHVVYDATRTIFVNDAHPRYAQFKVNYTSPETMVEESKSTGIKERKFLQSVNGHTIDGIPEGTGRSIGLGPQTSMAVDPVTGTVLVIKGHTASWEILNNAWSKEIHLPLQTFFEPRLAPADNNRFFAVVIGDADNQWTDRGVPVLYLQFSQGVWSAPVELGVADIASFGGGIWNAVQIGSNGGRDALAIWPTPKGLVARWIVLME
jgi:hypothetical protein